MKYIFQIAIIFLFSFCDQINNYKGYQSKKENIKEIVNDFNKNSCKLSENFNSFRKELKLNNIEDVKKYIDFPFTNANIWHLIFMDSEDENYDFSRDLNEDDFDKYHQQIFPLELIESLMDIDVNYLISKGLCEAEIKYKSDEKGNIETKYKLSAKFNDFDKELIFSMYYEFYEDEEIYETSVIYKFILRNCELKLNKVILAN